LLAKSLRAPLVARFPESSLTIFASKNQASPSLPQNARKGSALGFSQIGRQAPAHFLTQGL